MLIIEDNAAMRRALRTLLEDLIGEARIIEVDDAEAALEACRVRPPHIVLLDLAVSGATGLNFLPHLRVLLPSAAIIVVSHAAIGVYAERALAAGADGYIDKDRIYEELIPTIERVRAARAGGDAGSLT